MKIVVSVLFACILCHGLSQKQTRSRYEVGYSDTVLFNREVTYSFQHYQGPAPLFVQIWHPLNRKPKSSSLTFGELRNEQLTGSLAEVYQQLESLSDSAFIEYNLLYTMDTEEEIGYDGFSHADLLEEAKLIPTSAYRSKFTGKGKFPVVVYHHGSQGISDENYLMAEYFASRGYIFITANFHLPYENLSYGAIPWGSSYFDTTAISTLTNFAIELAGDQPVYAIGHSWGAQVLWHYLKDHTTIDAFVSLETSLEFETDTAKVIDRWPELYQTLQTGKGHYNMPVLLMAATGNNQPFPWFKECGEQLLYCSPKGNFNHESYTSAYFSRYLMREELPQPDEPELKQQWRFHCRQLALMDRFFVSVATSSHLDLTEWRAEFYLNGKQDFQQVRSDK